MKKLTLIIILLFVIQFGLFSQTCLPDGIWFSTQEKIDDFRTNYPNCTKIEGHVSIGGFAHTTINNLNGLSDLTSIGDYLSISFNDSLITLSGLENLDSVFGDLWIEDNEPLTNVDGLVNLTSIGGQIMIKNNASLENISGLNNLDPNSFTDLTIKGNINLTECEVQVFCDYLSNPNGVVDIFDNASGCNNPSEIADGCGINLTCLPYGNYYLLSQPEIDSFQVNYSNCANIKGNVKIEGDSIINIFGLNNCTSIEGDLIIDETSLLNLNGLDSLNYIGNDLIVSYNDSLVSLSGLEELDSIGNLFSLFHNEDLINLDGLEALTKIDHTLLITGNYKLNSLNGLNGLNSIGHKLRISYNYDLTNLNGLENVTTINGALVIRSNSKLTNIEGIKNIDPYSINTLDIFWNSSLSSCEVQSVCTFLTEMIGGYEISSNNEGCMSRDEVIEACILGVSSNESQQKNMLYPNPANKELFFIIPDNFSINQIVIYSQFGEKVYFTNNNYQQLDISHFKQGLYIVEFVSDDLRLRQKLMVQH